MPRSSDTLRTIITSHRVDVVLDRLEKQHPRFRDLWDGWQWRLVRAPTRDAVPVPGEANWWVIKTTDWASAGLPMLRILFRLDSNTIEIVVVDVV